MKHFTRYSGGPGHEGMATFIAARRCFACQGHMLGVGNLSSLISFFPPYLPGRHALTPLIAYALSILRVALCIDTCTVLSLQWLRIDLEGSSSHWVNEGMAAVAEGHHFLSVLHFFALCCPVTSAAKKAVHACRPIGTNCRAQGSPWDRCTIRRTTHCRSALCVVSSSH